MLEVSGVDLPEMDGFDADLWRNDEGESGWRGYVNGAAGGWTFHQGGAWVAFDADLPAGNYLVEVQLATRLWSNNLNDSMRVEIQFSARDNVEQTRSAQLVNAQMRDLYKRATNRALSPDLVDHMVCLLYTSPSPRDATLSRMPSSA